MEICDLPSYVTKAAVKIQIWFNYTKMQMFYCSNWKLITRTRRGSMRSYLSRPLGGNQDVLLESNEVYLGL